MKMTNKNMVTGPVGFILHRPVLYDILVRLRTLNREQVFRNKILRLARIEPGNCVLDVGCGTGTLAIAAKRAVSPGGEVYGIDPSPEMLARADKKAKSAALSITFKLAPAQALPFHDAQFDVVLSTLMLHHLPCEVRRKSFHEMRRVLKPGGKLLIVDAGNTARTRIGRIARIHRHGHVCFSKMAGMFSKMGLSITENGMISFTPLQYVLATKVDIEREG